MARFEEVDGEIYDKKMGQIITMDEFRRLSRGKAGDQFEQELSAEGGLVDTEDALLSSPDDATLAAVNTPEQGVPDEDVTPVTPQQIAAQAGAIPVAADGANLPMPRSARPPLDEYMEVMRAHNPGVSDRTLHQAWAKKFGSDFYDPKNLPTWEDFKKNVAPANPGVPEKRIREEWEKDYGDFGAREKPPTFLESMKEGLIQGGYGLRASSAGTIDRLQNPDTALKQVASDVGDMMEREAAKHAPRSSLQNEPWYQKIIDKEWLGNTIGNAIAGTAPSLAGAVVGGISGGPPGAAVGVVISTYFQVAGSRYRDAYKEAHQEGLDARAAHEKAYDASGVAGITSGLINALGIPASYMTPFASGVKNLFTQYVANIAVDTADQASQNVLEGKPISTGMTETIVGSALLGSPETMIAAKSIATGPGKVEPPKQVLDPASADTTTADGGPPAPGSPGAPLKSPMTPKSEPDLDVILDESNSLEDAIEKAILFASDDVGTAVTGAEVSTPTIVDPKDIPVPPPATPMSTPSLTPSQPVSTGAMPEVAATDTTVTTDIQPSATPSQVMPPPAAATLPTQPQEAPSTSPQPVAALPTTGAVVPSSVTTAAAVSDIRTLAGEIGLDDAVLKNMITGIFKKNSLEELTPTEIKLLKKRLARDKAAMAIPEEVAAAPAAQDAPLQPNLEEEPSATNVYEAAQVPRHELPPEQNAEMLARAEKAQADLEIAGNERGGRWFIEQDESGSTQEVVGLKSPTADWFKEATTGPKKLSRQRVEIAVQKILQDKGRDKGKDVQRVKELLMLDREFNRSPFAPKTKQDWENLIAAATENYSTPTPEAPAPRNEKLIPKSQRPVTEPTPSTRRFRVIPLSTARGGKWGVMEVTEGTDADGKPTFKERQVADAPSKRQARAIADEKTKSLTEEPGEVYKHFTTPEGKAALESGQPFDYEREPQHGTGGFERAKGTGKMAGKRLYLSMEDKAWETARTPKDGGVAEDVPDKTGPDDHVFYDYDKQKWQMVRNGIVTTKLSPVSYRLAPDAKVLTIDGPVALGNAMQQTGVKYIDDETLWDKLAQRYDAVKITNVKHNKQEGRKYFKFFKAAKADQLIVLNPEKATVVKPKTFTSEQRRAPQAGLFGGSEEQAALPMETKETAPKPTQTEIAIPPETIGSRPIIGREATPEEAPLFSKAAQEKEPEQGSLLEKATPSLGKRITNNVRTYSWADEDTDLPALTKEQQAEANTIAAAVEGKTLHEVARWMSLHGPSKSYRLIAKLVATRLKQLEGIGQTFKLVVMHTEQDRARLAAQGYEMMRGARGLTGRSSASTLTAVVLAGKEFGNESGMEYETVLHELVHAVTQTALILGDAEVFPGVQSKKGIQEPLDQFVKELSVLRRAVIQHLNDRVDAHNRGELVITEFEERLLLRMNNTLDDVHEVLAWGLTNKDFQAMLETIQFESKVNTGDQLTLWDKLVGAIREFLGIPATEQTALAEVLRIGERLMTTPLTDFQYRAKQANPDMLYRNERKAQSSDPDKPFTSARREEPRSPLETGQIDPDNTRHWLRAAKKTLRPYLLGSLSLSQIADVYKDHEEVVVYNKTTQDMKAEFINLTNQADPLIRKWDALPTNVSARMAKIMEEARIANYDPASAGTIPPSTDAERKLVTDYKLLTDGAKKVYAEARDFYGMLMNERFKSIIARINRMNVPQKEKNAAIAEVAQIHKTLAKKVYFPLTRFGEYIVIAKKFETDEKGKEKEVDREVYAFESSLESERFATQMKARGWRVKSTVMKEYNLDRDGAASKLTERMLAAIDKLTEGGGSASKEQLKDSINQLALQALPEMSYAKHYIHAKDVKGASVDALRAFAHSALHGAHHIARIKHADKLSRTLNQMEKRIDKADGDVTEDRQVHNELVLRHGSIINPNTHPFAAFLGQLGFTMSLGGVVATGVTNMTQTPLITFPWLGARYGFGKSSLALGKAYADFLDPKTLNRDSFFDATKSKRITEEERSMLKQLQREGHIDLTQTMDLSGRAAQDNLSRVAKQIGTKRERMMQMLGFTFHAPEVMNRQVSALATFRLEKSRSSDYDTSLSKAREAIVGTHYIYTQEERARYMSGNFMRVLSMFKQYGQRVAYMYGKAAHVWLADNKATAEERAIAKRQILMQFSLQLGAAGYLGVPFLGTVAGLLNILMNALGDEDEKKDWETETRKIISDNLQAAFGEEEGKWAAEVAAHGASRLTPWDLSARLGQSDLFIRGPKMEREGRAAAMDWATSLAGPVVGYGVNAWLGVEDLAKAAKTGESGHFLRGMEELVPAVVRHGIKTLRYAMEDGVRTRDGYKQMDVNGYQLAGQLFGFTPGKAAEMYEGVTAVKQQEHRIVTQRAALLDAFAAAVEDNDEEKIDSVMQRVTAFNERTPILHISGDTLRRSLRGRAIHEAGMEEGTYLPRTRQPLRDQGRFANY